jgi:hypothetical protein
VETFYETLFLRLFAVPLYFLFGTEQRTVWDRSVASWTNWAGRKRHTSDILSNVSGPLPLTIKGEK